jgi:hypothetical protein
MARVRILAGLSAAAFAVAFIQCSLTNLDGYAEGTTGNGSSGNGSSSGASGGNGSSGSSGGVDAGDLPPGKIQCAQTSTICDITSAQCCVTIVGESSAAVRSLSSSSAKCTAVGAGCGQMIDTGNTFTLEFAQNCSNASNCGDGEACCVLPLEGQDRFSKTVGSIECVPKATCNTKGRVLCRGADDCATTESCLSETDPILSHLYGNFCR